MFSSHLWSVSSNPHDPVSDCTRRVLSSQLVCKHGDETRSLTGLCAHSSTHSLTSGTQLRSCQPCAYVT